MNNRLYIITLTGFLLIFLVGCQKEKKTERDYPQIKTSPVDQITSEGARFNANITSGNSEGISEFGFVWGEYDNLNILNSEKATMEGAPETDQYSLNISSVLVAMKEYFVRAYVKSGDLVIYGDPVKFISLGSMAPEITDFEPKSATWGDTITIYGNNFSAQNYFNKVLFDEIGCTPSQSSSNMMKVQVPITLNKFSSYISLEILGNRTTASEVFNLLSPIKVYSLSPSVVSWLDTLVISGEFPTEIPITAKIDDKSCTIAYKKINELGVLIPESLLNYDNPKISLKFNNHSLIPDLSFTLQKPFVENSTSFSGNPGDIISLTGYFNPVLQNNSVDFGSGNLANIVKCTKNNLQFAVPEIRGSYSQNVNVTSGNILIISNKPFNYTLPAIIGSSLASGSQYEQITISGSGFIQDQTSVYLGEYQLTITGFSPTQLSVMLPNSIPNGVYNFKLKVLDQTINSNVTYQVKRPRIIDFNPKEATYGDIITIQVENFSTDLWVTLNNGSSLEITSQTATEIKVKMPDFIPLISNSIYVCNELANDFLVLKKPEIKYYPEISSTRNKNLVIESKYTSSWVGAYEVKIGDVYTFVENITSSSFEIVIPLLPAGEYTVEVKIAEYNFIITDHFTLLDVWSVYSNIPPGIYSGIHYPASFIIDDKIHIVGGLINEAMTNQSCFFNFQSKTWENISAFPGYERVLAAGWAINNTGYVGFGHANSIDADLADVYRYDSQSDTWSLITHSFPGKPRRLPFAVTIGGKAYIGGGTNPESGKLLDFYEFDPGNETWIQKSDIPDLGFGINAIAVNDIIYAQTGHYILKYNPGADLWTSESIQSEVPTYIYPAFAIEGKIYYSTRDQNPAIYWRYDINSSSWQRLSDCIYPANFGISFSYQGFGFTGLGYDRTIFMYDPTLEP